MKETIVPVTRTKVLSIGEAAQALSHIPSDNKPYFAYWVATIMGAVEAEMDRINATLNAPVSEELAAFERKRQELCQRYARKAGGEPVSGPDGNYVIDDLTAFQAALEKLKEEMPGAYEKRQEHTEALDAFMAEKVDVVATRIPLERIPGGVKGGELAPLRDFIDVDITPA